MPSSAIHIRKCLLIMLELLKNILCLRYCLLLMRESNGLCIRGLAGTRCLKSLLQLMMLLVHRKGRIHCQ